MTNKYIDMVKAAQALLADTAGDPVAVVAAADELLAEASGTENQTAAATAFRAKGLALASLFDLDAAVASLESARSMANGVDDPVLGGEIEMSYAGVLSWAGRGEEARRAIDAAIGLLSGVERARALVQRGSMRYRNGEFKQAMADLNEAQPSLEDVGDTVWRGRLLNNRALVSGFLGDIHGAEDDLRDALSLYEAGGKLVAAAECIQNLGWILSAVGDIPGALRNFDDAADRFASVGYPAYELWGDRCEALLSANLVDDALALADRAVAELRGTEHRAAMAEALLRLARATLLAKHTDAARSAAAEAAAMLREQDRPAWAAQAQLLEVESRFTPAVATEPNLLALAVDAAASLTDAGFAQAALRAHLLASKIAIASGETEAATSQLDLAAAASDRGPADLRVDAWLTRALLRRSVGDSRGAARAARAGLQVVDEYQAMLGASDARAAVAGHASELARLGLGLAAESRNARRLFQWMERTRAGALRFPPVSPPDDQATAADLAEFRYIEQQLVDPDTQESEIASLQARRVATQERIRRRSLATAAVDSHAPPLVDPGDILDELADRTLVEYGRVDGELHAIVLSSGRVRQFRLGDAATLLDDLDSVRFSVRRLMSRRGSAASLEAGLHVIQSVLDKIDSLLVRPIGVEATRVVVVPNGDLHAVPWNLLPTWLDSAVELVPSAGMWMRRKLSTTSDSTVLVAGPRLEHAEREVLSLQRIYPDATTYTAEDAHVDNVLASCDGASLVHVASHGAFRSDNPLFSSLELGNGPLTVYDIERLHRAPQTIVLSACDAGLPAHRPGNEIMGLVAALLAAGSTSIIAASGLVPDTGATLDFMADLHGRLAAGLPASVALRQAQRTLDPSSEAGLAAGSFTCFGRS